ncbi:MAG: hypothetical protein H2174_10720 [Vampirovibrio sp.]|nr:hypothetical protein [Vampirovibrio sp.]
MMNIGSVGKFLTGGAKNVAPKIGDDLAKMPWQTVADIPPSAIDHLGNFFSGIPKGVKVVATGVLDLSSNPMNPELLTRMTLESIHHPPAIVQQVTNQTVDSIFARQAIKNIIS